MTKNQFRQCLAFLDLNASEEEKEALEARYCDINGFRYIVFLDHVSQPEERNAKYLEQLTRLMNLNKIKKPVEIFPETDPKKIFIRLQVRLIIIFHEKLTF